jgi:DNA-binding transcriptional MocR family regulator
VRRAIEQNVAFVPGAPLFAMNPDLSTLQLSFATADVKKIEEGVGGWGKRFKATPVPKRSLRPQTPRGSQLELRRRAS